MAAILENQKSPHLLLISSMHTLEKALPTLFCIHELTDAHNWLLSLWLTGERDYVIPPHPVSNRVHLAPGRQGERFVFQEHQNLGKIFRRDITFVTRQVTH